MKTCCSKGAQAYIKQEVREEKVLFQAFVKRADVVRPVEHARPCLGKNV